MLYSYFTDIFWLFEVHLQESVKLDFFMKPEIKCKENVKQEVKSKVKENLHYFRKKKKLPIGTYILPSSYKSLGKYIQCLCENHRPDFCIHQENNTAKQGLQY